MAYDNDHRRDARGAVGIVTLNRPQVLNALSTQVIAELGQALWRPSMPIRRSAPLSSPATTRPSRPAPTSRRCSDKTYVDNYLDDFLADWDQIAASAEAGDRRGGRLSRWAAAASWR